jgi:hypothetical protein
MAKLNVGESTSLNDPYPEHESALLIKHLIDRCIRFPHVADKANPESGMRGISIVRGMDI